MDGSEGIDDDLTPPVTPHLLAKNILWLSTGEFLSRLIASIVAVTLARRLGAESYGTLGIALALVSYLVVLVDGGLDPVAVREVARKPAGVPALFPRIVGQRLIVALVMFALLTFLVFLLPDRIVGGQALALVFGGRLFTYALKCDWALRGREEMGAVALGLIVQHVLYALGIFVLVSRSTIPLVLIPVIHVGAEAALVVFYLAWLRKSYPRLWARTAAPQQPDDILRQSVPVGLGKVLRLAYYEGDLLLLGWLTTSEQAGYFFASQRIALALLALAILHQQTAFPALSRLMLVNVPEGARFQDAVSRYALYWSVPVAAGGVYLSGPLMEWLFGAAYRESGPILAIMLFGLPVILVQFGLHNQMLALGQTRPYLYTVAAGTAVHVGLGLLWVPHWGGVGAAWANLLGECVMCGLAACFTAVKHRAAPLGGRSLAVCAGGALMVLVMFFARRLGLLEATLIGALAYGAAVLTLGGFTMQEARKLIALFRSTRKVADRPAGPSQ